MPAASPSPSPMSDAHTFAKGQQVRWQWAGNDAFGKVEERFDRDVERTLKGTKVTRHGSKDDPACLIKQDDGDQVLKLGWARS